MMIPPLVLLSVNRKVDFLVVIVVVVVSVVVVVGGGGCFIVVVVVVVVDGGVGCFIVVVIVVVDGGLGCCIVVFVSSPEQMMMTQFNKLFSTKLLSYGDTKQFNVTLSSFFCSVTGEDGNIVREKQQESNELHHCDHNYCNV